MLSALAGGPASLSYQWYSFGTNLIAGATNSTLALSNLTGSSSQNFYTVIVAAASVSVTSGPVTLSFPATTAPRIILAGSAITNIPLNGSFVDPGASATDGCGGASLAVTTFGTVNTSVLGAYVLNYQATNAFGASAIVARIVNVICSPSTAPTIVITGANPMQVLLNQAFADPGATAADACNPSIVVTESGSVNTAVAGRYTLTYSAAGASGLTSIATRTVLVESSLECISPPSGLAGWWKGEWSFLDAAGTNNGTGLGGVSFAEGVVGEAFYFDGTNAGVLVPNSASLKPSQFTLEAWVQVDQLYSSYYQSNLQAIIYTQNSSTNAGYALGVNEFGNFEFIMARASSGAVGVQSSTLISPGQYYHVAATYDGSTASLYVNGELEGQIYVGFAPDYGAGPIFFGTAATNAGVYDFNGELDEIAIYQRALSQSEVATIYNASAAGKCVVNPIVLVPPTNLFVPIGSNAVFTALAGGQTPLTVQWQLDGTNLVNNSHVSGVAGQALVISSVTAADAGSYSFIVANAFGSVTSAPAILSVGVPASITEQPVSQTAGCGALVTFNSGANGSGTIGFQWCFNGMPLTNTMTLSGAATPSLALTSPQLSDSGSYTLVASNFFGVVTSKVATLNVVDSDQPAITLFGANPFQLLTGSIFIDPFAAASDACAGTLQISVSGSISNVPGVYTLTYSATNPSGVAVRTNRTVVVEDALQCVEAPSGIASWYPANGNAFDIVGKNNGLWVNGASYASAEIGQGFLFDGVSNYVQLPDNMFPFPTNGVGDQAFSLELWFETTTDGVILGQQNSPAFGSPSGWVPLLYVGTDGRFYGEMFWDGNRDQIIGGVPVNDGRFHHVAMTYDGSVESLYLDGLLVGSMPFVQNAYAQTYYYQLGTGYTEGSPYFFYFTGPPWPGGIQGWFSFNGIIDDVAYYNRALAGVEVANIFNAGSGGKCTLLPVILVQPTNQFAVVGTNVTFAISAGGLPPFAYQWLENGTNLADSGHVSGSSTNALTLFNVSTLDDGAYWVIVSNSLGSITSSVAVLQVGLAPSISLQPMSQTVGCGGSAVFTVGVAGSAPFAFQWYKGTSLVTNNSLIGQSATASLVFSNVVLADAGAYAVRIENSFGSVTSQIATLSAANDSSPVIAIQGLNPMRIPLGSSFADPGATASNLCGSLSVIASGAVNTGALGSYNITYVATDGLGNSVTNVRLVLVQAPFQVFNSGIADNGVSLPGGYIDPHYTLINSADPGSPGPAAYVFEDVPYNYFEGNTASSAWIGPADSAFGGSSAGGNFTYQMAFDLSIYDPNSAAIFGTWSTDNQGVEILINGQNTGMTANDFSQWYPFSITNGFVAGLNTIEFVVNNSGGPTALRVELSGTATPVVPWPPGNVPNLVLKDVSAVSTAQFGQAFPVTWAVTNMGGAAASNLWNDEVLLSGNPTNLAGAQILASAPAPSVLGAGQSYTNTASVSVSQATGLTPGSYYVVVVADSQNIVAQAIETNDTLAVPISLIYPPLPDLVVSSVTAPGSGVGGQTVEVHWTVCNNGHGDTDVPLWYDHLYLSSTANTGNAVADYGVFANPSYLAVGDCYEQVATVNLPVGVGGSLYFVVQANSTGALFEENETNNIGATASPISIQEVTAGFFHVVSVEVAPAPPSLTWPGAEITCTYVVQNIGQSPITGSWDDQITLSSVSNFVNGVTADYAYEDDITFTGPLAPGAFYTNTGQFTLPQSVGGSSVVGTWFVVPAVDIHFRAGSGDVGRDEMAAALDIIAPPQSDLVTTSVTAPATGVIGQSIHVSWTVENEGINQTSGSYWYDSVYLSLSSNFNAASSMLLGTFGHWGTLALDASYTNSMPVTLPTDIIGTSYIVVVANAGSNITEFTLSNNVLAATNPTVLTVPQPAGLVVTQVGPPGTAVQGAPITVSWSVQNNGAGTTSATSWSDSVYLSPTASLALAQATLVGSVAHNGALAPGASYSQTSTVTLPACPAGSFYVLVQADSGDQVNEGTATNQVGISGSPLTILPNADARLLVSFVDAPATAKAGEPLVVSWAVTDSSSATTNAPWADAVYLSESPEFNPENAILLGLSQHAGNLFGGATYTNSQTNLLPICLTGQYYVYVMADVSNVVNGIPCETNNVARSSSPIQVTATNYPALAVSAISVPTSAQGAVPFAIQWTVTNAGPNAAQGAWVDAVYVSTVPTFDSNAFLMGVYPNPEGLAAGSAYTQNQYVAFSTCAAGDFYVYVIADVSNRFDTAACRGQQPIVATNLVSVSVGAYPQLEVASIHYPSSTTAGQPLAVSWNVINAGTGSATGAWSDSVYLSSSSAFVASNSLLLGTYSPGKSLASDASYTGTINPALPSGLHGKFYVVVVTDSGNAVAECTGQTNNALVSSGTIEVTPATYPDLTVPSVFAPATAYSGQAITVSWIVANDGTASTGGTGWYDTIYLVKSEDQDQSIVQLGTFPRPTSLNAGQTYTNSQSMLLPASAAGFYSIEVIADSGGDLFNGVNEAANIGMTPSTLFVTLTPSADLAASGVTISPSTGLPGDTATISWQVTNDSTNTAPATWTDAVYLSTNTVWDLSAILVTTHDHSNLNPGASYGDSWTGPLPALTPGSYHAIVRTDVRNTLREPNLSNNVAASPTAISVDIPILVLGQSVSNQLSTGVEQYYKVNVPAGQTVQITLNSSSSDSANELYVRYGAVPDLGDYDFVFHNPLSPNQQVQVPTTEAGWYYILVRVPPCRMDPRPTFFHRQLSHSP